MLSGENILKFNSYTRCCRFEFYTAWFVRSRMTFK